MSKRDLKKNINATMELLYSDCVFYKIFVENADESAANKVLDHIADVHDEYLKRINVNEGKDVKGRVKKYYKILITDFKSEINAIAKEISTLP